MTGIAAGRLVMAALFREEKDWEGARHALEERFGRLDDEIIRFPFDWTDYYGDEMGPGLVRLLCSFRDVREQDELADIKGGTVDLERRFSVTKGGRSRRRMNLDPGILTLDRLVLATGTRCSCGRWRPGGCRSPTGSIERKRDHRHRRRYAVTAPRRP